MSDNGPPTCNSCGKQISFKKDEQNDKWLRFNPDGTPHTHERRGGAGGGGGGFRGRSAEELRDIRRESALKNAVAFAVSRSEMKSKDVVTVAQVFLEWIEKS